MSKAIKNHELKHQNKKTTARDFVIYFSLRTLDNISFFFPDQDLSDDNLLFGHQLTLHVKQSLFRSYSEDSEALFTRIFLSRLNMGPMQSCSVVYI